MSDGKTMNRWLVVLGAVLIQLCLGAIYAWSVFTPSLTDQAGPYQFTATQTQIIFSVGLATFARKHGEAFGRIELIRVVEGRISRLPLHELDVCKKVELVTDKDHLNSLFDQFSIG